MQKLTMLVAAGFMVLVASTGVAPALLDPAIHKLVRLEPLILGSKDNNFHMEPREYRLKVGQGYRWKIKAETDFEYALIAPAFFRNIWIRKIEVGTAEIKTPTLDEVEFEDVGEAELFFVAVRPGTYEFSLRGMEARGVKGTIIVDSADGS
jgi:uncharacterized cupredoxin-like copper-binding protein